MVEHFTADLCVVDSLTDCRDYTGDIAAENYRVVVRHHRGEQPGGGELLVEPYVRVG